MKKHLIPAAALFLMISNAWAFSSVTSPMTGKVVLDLVDNQGTTASAIEINGEGAKALWDNLNVKPITVKDHEYKNGTNLSCSRVDDDKEMPVTCRLVLASDGSAIPTGQ